MNRIGAAAAIALAGLLIPAIASAAEPPTAEQADRDKIICRKTAEVGSLVRKKKECYTKAQWDQIAEVQQRGAKKTQDGLSGGFNCQASGSC
jgi:hypothetical protein